ncbi:MAG: hypothetical protein YSLV5_ORF03 [Yellowstone Lake virophage 5]|uniref:Uncharacterized protein n=1 Tax=Yellowstone Lake virophage 5 TaxID=1557033 RepID=A0A0A0RJS0_9VIRU|nr:MAG: hypothetical protein ASQ69_gp03 [Yellowstone Lake virophage 5]AIW01861.1 MAG: hypothetical protein YSLV5_ORF03 [Yellowstone Lake virophage 5]
MSSVASILTGTPAVVNPALVSGGGGGGSTAPQFTATGVAGAGGFVSSGAGANVTLNNGTFVSYVDTLAVPPGGAEVVVLGSDVGGNGPRWTIGYNNSDVGDGFAGADLAVKCYADDGNLIATPFSIARDTGIVSMPESFEASAGEVGAPATVGGGVLNINGTLGLSRVYDQLYNVPPATAQGAYAFQSTKLAASTFVDFISNGNSTIITAPVPVGAQNASIFKLRVVGGWTYATPSGFIANMAIYGATDPAALVPDDTSMDTVMVYDVFSGDQIRFEVNPHFLVGSEAVSLVYLREMVFTVTNPTLATVTNLYLVVRPTPADGSQTIGSVTTDNGGPTYANCEAYL